MAQSNPNTDTTTAADTPPEQKGTGISSSYSYYVLGMLLFVYIINFIDRQVLSILIEPIKEDLLLTDTQLGLLGGIAFAIFYTTCGIPLARLADRVSRVKLLSACLTIWSLMTVLTGYAQSFTYLLLARIGVGVGEAGASPSSHSMISDLFPENKRGTALSIYALGIPLGTLVGFGLGGVLANTFGWRTAFIVVGAPGVLVALWMVLTVREPPRGLTSPAGSSEPVPFGVALRYLLGRKSFVHLAIASGLCAFTGYGNAVWIPSLMARVHEVPLDERGYMMALLAGVISSIGTFLGGWLADTLSTRRAERRWYLWVPVLGQTIGLPFILAAFMADSAWSLVWLAAPAYIFGSLWLGPIFAVVQNLSQPAMRAFASSILLFILNIIGLGLGPAIIGILSDLLEPTYGVEAIRYALIWVTVVVTLWGVLHLLLAAISIEKDMPTSVPKKD